VGRSAFHLKFQLARSDPLINSQWLKPPIPRELRIFFLIVKEVARAPTRKQPLYKSRCLDENDRLDRCEQQFQLKSHGLRLFRLLLSLRLYDGIGVEVA
jgi:hypothetical protein